MTTITGRIRPRYDSAADFTSGNPTLAAGELATESDTGRQKVGDGSTAWTSLPYIGLGRIEPPRAISIDEPTTGDEASLGFTPVAITVTHLHSVVRGSSPSITWTIRHSTDRSATGNEVVTSGTTTTNTTTGTTTTSFNDATIPANSWMWIEVTGESGTNDELAVVMRATRDLG